MIFFYPPVKEDQRLKYPKKIRTDAEAGVGPACRGVGILVVLAPLHWGAGSQPALPGWVCSLLSHHVLLCKLLILFSLPTGTHCFPRGFSR